MGFAWAVVYWGSAGAVVMGGSLAAVSAADAEAVAVPGTGAASGLGIWAGVEVETGQQSVSVTVFEDDLESWDVTVSGQGSWPEAAFGWKSCVGLVLEPGTWLVVVVGLGPEVAVTAVVGLRSWTAAAFGRKAGFEAVVEAAVSAGSELVV